MSIVLAQH